MRRVNCTAVATCRAAGSIPAPAACSSAAATPSPSAASARASAASIRSSTPMKTGTVAR